MVESHFSLVAIFCLQPIFGLQPLLAGSYFKLLLDRPSSQPKVAAQIVN